MKPDNILVSARGEVKVADLGLAKAVTSPDGVATASCVVMGTPQYMPPEQCRDAKAVGPAADVYSLGATLYYLVTGKDGIAAGALVKVLERVCNEPFPDVRSERPDVRGRFREPAFAPQRRKDPGTGGRPRLPLKAAGVDPDCV